MVQARERRNVGVVLESGFERVSDGSKRRLFTERARAGRSRRGGCRDRGLGSVRKGSAWGMVEEQVVGGERVAPRVCTEKTPFSGYCRRWGDDCR